MSLHQLLVEMHVSDETVKDVQKAEDEVRSSAPLHMSSLAAASTTPSTASTTIFAGSDLFKLEGNVFSTGPLLPVGTIGTIGTIVPSTSTVFVPSGTISFSLSDQVRSATRKSDDTGGGENE